jgi:hypothetical protein
MSSTRKWLFILALGAIVGCQGDQPPTLSEVVPSEATDATVPLPKTPNANDVATKIAVTEASPIFDSATCEITSALLPMGQGSVAVDINQRKGGVCTFEYTFDVEGGYTVYRVSVPVDGGLVDIHAQPGQTSVETRSPRYLYDCGMRVSRTVFYELQTVCRNARGFAYGLAATTSRYG